MGYMSGAAGPANQPPFRGNAIFMPSSGSHSLNGEPSHSYTCDAPTCDYGESMGGRGLVGKGFTTSPLLTSFRLAAKPPSMNLEF